MVRMTPDSMGREGADQAAEQAQFLASIFERYGYDLRGYAPASMRRRIGAALGKSGLSTVPQLAARSVADPAFFTAVLESLTVRVSSMFRDPCFYRALGARVFPLLRLFPRLNIWHAGCATGEEAYSTAMLLADQGLYDRCQIYATDLSPPSLEVAKLGVYSATALPELTEGYRAAGGRFELSRYITQAYGRISIHESLRRNIIFFQHDLVGDHLFGEMDLILCRNVMIYFGRQLKARVAEKLGDGLRPGGFLCLGRSEQLSLCGRGRFSERAAPERIYQKASPA
jgi:chemotaxis protein methyltransferase CheR